MRNNELIVAVQDQLDDDGTEFTPTMILRQLEAGSKKIAGDTAVKRALFNETSVTITLVAGQDEYSLPTNYNYSVDRVVLDPNGGDRELMPLNWEQIHDLEYNAGGNINYYAVRGDKLILVGKPDTSSAGQTLEVWYAKVPDAFLNDTVETILGKKCPHMLIDYCVRKLTLRSPDLRGISQEAKVDFNEGMEDLRREFEGGGIGEARFMDTPDDHSIG